MAQEKREVARHTSLRERWAAEGLAFDHEADMESMTMKKRGQETWQERYAACYSPICRFPLYRFVVFPFLSSSSILVETQRYLIGFEFSFGFRIGGVGSRLYLTPSGP
jgi:hypothetical protein